MNEECLRFSIDGTQTKRKEIHPKTKMSKRWRGNRDHGAGNSKQQVLYSVERGQARGLLQQGEKLFLWDWVLLEYDACSIL